MSRYLFSGSAVHRAVTCPASCVLPQVYEPSGPAAQAGTTVHRFVERAAHVGREASLAEIPAGALGRDMCESLDLEAIPIDYLSAEVEIPLAYDVANGTARVLIDAAGNRVSARGYRHAVPPLRATEIPMTLDALEFSPRDGIVIVSDLKTGNPHEDEYAAQVTLGVLAATAYYAADGYDIAGQRAQLVYLRGGVYTHAWDVSQADIDAMHARLVEAFAVARDLRSRAITAADVSPGEHCKYCPARMKSCPASHEAAQALATTEPTDALAAYRATLATPEGRGNAWARLPLLEAMVATMRTELDAAVIANGGVTPQGETLGAVTTERRRVVDAQAAYDWLRSWHCTTAEQADAICPASTTRTATLGALERVLGRAEARRAIEGLEACGAIQTSVSTKAGVVKARKGKAA